MKLVQAGEAFSFNYTAYDQNSGLFVAFSVYDVSTGSAVFIQKIVSAYSSFGAYMANYEAIAAKTYLVIGVVYTDNTYTVVDTTRAPSSEVYQALGNHVNYLGFAYAAYDQASTLHLRASVYDMTSGAPVFVQNSSMTHVAFGVYFGSFGGTLGETYQIIEVVYTDGTFVTPNFAYAPNTDDFDCLQIGIGIFGAAYLIGTESGNNQIGFNIQHTQLPPIIFTQGDTASLFLTAVDAQGNPVDLTGAVLTSYINGANGQAVNSFSNSEHTINPDQVDNTGQFILNLSSIDTANCGLGDHQELLTKAVAAGNTAYFRGFNLLGILPPEPFN